MSEHADRLAAFFHSVMAERDAQLAKWGDQRYPDLDPRDIPYATHTFNAQRAENWRGHNTERARQCTGTDLSSRCPKDAPPHAHTAWDGLLMEQTYRVLADPDPAKLRAELVRVAALCAAWAGDIDRRSDATTNTAEEG